MVELVSTLYSRALSLARSCVPKLSHDRVDALRKALVDKAVELCPLGRFAVPILTQTPIGPATPQDCRLCINELKR